MERFMMDNLKMTRLKEKVNFAGQMVGDMLENGLKIGCMGKEFYFLKMEEYMKVSFLITKGMGKVQWNWRMGESSKGNLKIIAKTDKAF